jgi:hypothetical protein
MATYGTYQSDEAVTGQDRVTLNRMSGASQINKFSYRTVIDTTDGDALIIADNTTNTPTILSTASTFTVTYNNATDGFGTTGARSLLFSYIDADETQQSGELMLTGTGSDATTFTGLGINRVVVLSSGSAKMNTNNITITATTGGSVQAFLAALSSVTEQLLIHMPAGKTPVVKHLFLSAEKLSGGGVPRVTFKIFAYSRITQTTYQVFRYLMDTSVVNHVEINDPCNFPFSPRDVVYVTANTTVNGTEASARLSLNLYEN